MSMKAATSGIPGSIAACAVSGRLLCLNLAAIMIRADKAATEAFQASEGLHVHGYRSDFTAGDLLLAVYLLEDSIFECRDVVHQNVALADL